MLASVVPLLLALSSSGLATEAAKDCAAEAGGICESPELEVVLLQSQMQLQRQRHVEAGARAEPGSPAPRSQLGVGASAGAEAKASQPSKRAAPAATAAPAARGAATPAAAAGSAAELTTKLAAEPASAGAALALQQRQQWPLGDIVGGISDLLPGAAKKVVDGATAAATRAAAMSFAAIVNSSLILLEEKADTLMSYCAAYKSSILLNVSQSGTRRIDTLRESLLTHVGIVLQFWSLFVNTLSAAGPRLVSAVAGLGLTSFSVDAQAGLDRILQLAGDVTSTLHNVSALTTKISGSSKEELHGVFRELNATIDAGLGAARGFAHEAVQLLQKIIAGAAAKFGVSLLKEVQGSAGKSAPPDDVTATFQGLLKQVSDGVSKISTGMTDYLSGTVQAAKIVLSPADENSSAISIRSWSGLFLVVVCLGASIS